MAHTRPTLPKALPLGDATVDGLLSGVGAGVVMALYLVLAGLLAGAGPAATLGLFDAGQTASPLNGSLMHLAVAGVYGALFGALISAVSHRWHVRAPRAWGAGAAYGLLLFAAAQIAILPATPALARIALPNFLAAHLVYGVVLGFLFDRGAQV